MSTYSDLKGGIQTTVYSTAADLPLTGVSGGAQAYVTETHRLYLWNGSGWYSIALINTAPTITTGAAATYALAIDGTATVITLVATDPESVPITWSHAVTTGSIGSAAVVTQSANVFTVTPSSTAADAGTFSLTFTASDGINVATSTSAFTLSFVVEYDWSALSSGTATGLGATSISTQSNTSSLGGSNITWREITGNSTHTIAYYTDSNDSYAPWIVVSTIDGTLVKNWKFDTGSVPTGGWRCNIQAGEGWFTIFRETAGVSLYDLSNIANSTHGLVTTTTASGLVAGWKYGTKFVAAHCQWGVSNRDVEKFIVYDMSNSMAVLHTYNTSSGSSYSRGALYNGGDKFYMPLVSGKLVIMDLDDYSTTTHAFTQYINGPRPTPATDGVHYVVNSTTAGTIRIYNLSTGSFVRSISNAAYRWRDDGYAWMFSQGPQLKITADGLYIIGVTKVTSASATTGRHKLSVWKISDGSWVGSVDSQSEGRAYTHWAYGSGVITTMPASSSYGTSDGLHIFTIPTV